MDFVQLVQFVGFPAAVLVAVGLGLWRVVVWTGREIIIPLRNSAVTLIDRVGVAFGQQATALEQLTATGCGRPQAPAPAPASILPFARQVVPSDRGA